MKRLLSRRIVWVAPVLLAVVFATAILAALIDENTKIEDLYDWGLHKFLVEQQATSLQDLTGRFLDDQYLFLYITPPDPDFILFQPGGMIPILDLKAFPDEFIDGLVGTIGKDGIRRFPIWVYEDPDSPGREIVIENAEGKQLARLKREWNYSPDWFVRERHPELDTYEKWYRDWLLASYDPSRICMRYDLLVGEDDLIKYVWAQSIAAAQSPPGGGMLKSGWEGGTVSNLQFVAIDKTTNGTIELTIAWPEDGLATNMVDFFACTNLMVQNWEIAVTTNVDLNTNCFSWIDEDSTNYTIRFYDCWTLDDTDGDGISDGREKRLYGSDPDDTDSDDDGLGDGTEINVTETDPADCDTDDDGLVDGYDGYHPVASYTNGVDANTNGYVDGEYDFGTDPKDADSDDDTFGDGYEVYYGTDPTNAASFPATLSGTIIYSGGQTGSVHALAVESSASWSETRSAVLAVPGVYTISNTPTLNSYWIKAYRDSNTNGVRDAWEAWGAYVSNAVAVVTNTTGLDITLTDPDLDGDGMPDWQELDIINADTNDAIETIDHVFEWADFDGDGVSNGDEIALGTDPNNSNSVPPVLRFSAAATSVSESASNVVVSIDLLPAASDTVQATLSVIGGNADNGTDYAFTNQTVTFSAAETNEQINVTIYVNDPGEAAESIVFKLAGLGGPAAMGTPDQFTVWITDSFADSDSDGLPDSWEQQYFGNLSQGAAGDPDGDNVSNLTEFKQGRHPNAGAVADTNNVLKLNVITPLR